VVTFGAYISNRKYKLRMIPKFPVMDNWILWT
jgi:hypothetical protein